MKTCSWCKENNIDHTKDTHFRITGYDNGQKGRTLFYHLDCWKAVLGKAKKKHYQQAQRQGTTLFKKWMKIIKED